MAQVMTIPFLVPVRLCETLRRWVISVLHCMPFGVKYFYFTRAGYVDARKLSSWLMLIKSAFDTPGYRTDAPIL